MDQVLTLIKKQFNERITFREKILARTLYENGLYVDEKGKISLDAKSEYAYNAIMQYVQAISKISNMRLYKRVVAKSEFFDKLTEFIEGQLLKFQPVKNFRPIASRDDLSVDFKLGSGPRPLFLFGVNSIPKARLITICRLEYLNGKIPFRSVVIHEDFESLNKNDRKHLTNVVNKQFTDLDDFRQDGMTYLEREAA